MSGSPPDDRCGYEWNPKNINRPLRQNCCYRETISGADRCPWHALPSADNAKSIENLQNCRENPENRKLNADKDAPQELLDGARLSNSNLNSSITLENVFLRGADFSNAILQGIILSGSNLFEADLFEATLWDAELDHTFLLGADLSDTRLRGADISHANMPGANFNSAGLWEADLTNTNIRTADFTDADLRRADLSHADAERAIFTRTDLFGTNFTDTKLYGARFSDAQIDENTIIGELSKNNYSWINPQWPRCAYDPRNKRTDIKDEDKLAKAAGTYRLLGELAKRNAFPKLQRQMFIQRKDMQLKRYYQNESYLNWIFALSSRSLFKYGESVQRVGIWAMIVIVGFAGLYSRFGLIKSTTQTSTIVFDGFLGTFIDKLYFSTLTFTTLGLGDFRPINSTGRLLVTIEAALGAILIAMFVYVVVSRAER